ncbi:MAG: TetR/AcrR family transcriptional regulator [Alphaproteobacteria bacterium]|nr:TetR/AcrR family transcriptional regulator [Alphaproteobacteria bacterium]
MSNIDRRAARTRTLLSQALMDLGASRSIDGIDVGDLVGAAGVARSTFYGHYSNKEDFLIRSFVGMIGAGERDERAQIPDRTALAPARYLFAHVYSAQEFAAQFVQSEFSTQVFIAGEAKLREIVDENLKVRAPAWNAARRHETAVYVAAGLMGLIRWWMLNSFNRTPEQMEAAFARLSAAAMLDDA